MIKRSLIVLSSGLSSSSHPSFITTSFVGMKKQLLLFNLERGHGVVLDFMSTSLVAPSETSFSFLENFLSLMLVMGEPSCKIY